MINVFSRFFEKWTCMILWSCGSTTLVHPVIRTGPYWYFINEITIKTVIGIGANYGANDSTIFFFDPPEKLMKKSVLVYSNQSYKLPSSQFVILLAKSSKNYNCAPDPFVWTEKLLSVFTLIILTLFFRAEINKEVFKRKPEVLIIANGCYQSSYITLSQ